MKLGKRVIAIMLSTIMSVSVMNTNMLTIRAAADINIAMEENAEDILEGENQDEDVTVTEETENAGNENDATTAPASENVTEDIEDTEDTETTDETNTIDENDDEEEADTKEIVPEEEKNKLATTEDDTKTTEDTSKDKIAPQDLEEEEQDEEEESEGKVRLSEKNFPDENFRKYLYFTFVNSEATDEEWEQYAGDVYITIADVTEINCSYYEISSLEGINVFSELVWLNASYNQLSKIELNGFENLIFIDFAYNNITEVYIKNCVSLVGIEELIINGWLVRVAEGNNIKKIHIQGCTSIENIMFSGGSLYNSGSGYYKQINEINVSDCANLKNVVISGINLEKMNVANCVNLESILVKNTLLHTIDTTGCEKLSRLELTGNDLEELNVKDNKNLETVYVDHNKIEKLDLSGLEKMTKVSCSYNNMTEVDLSGCTALEIFEGLLENEFISIMLGNSLKSINLKGCTSLSVVRIFDSLDTPYDGTCGCEYINFEDCTGLEMIDISGIQLESVNVSNCISLYDLRIYDSGLKYLDAAECVNLLFVQLNDNEIDDFGDLHLSDSEKMLALWLNGNNLEKLDVGGYDKLNYLDCYDNNIKELILSKNGKFSWIDCSGNKLISTGIYGINRDVGNGWMRFGGSEQILSISEINYKNGVIDLVEYEDIDTARIKNLKGARIKDNKIVINSIGEKNGYISFDYDCAYGPDFDKNERCYDCILNVKITDITKKERMVSINDLDFPDENFRAYLFDNLELDENNSIDASLVTNIDCSDCNIANLKGIELFRDLEELNCSGNELTSLDLIKNLMLENLDCSNNKIMYLNLPEVDGITLTSNTQSIDYYNSGFATGALALSDCDGLYVDKIKNLTGATINEETIVLNESGISNKKIAYTYQCNNSISLKVTITGVRSDVELSKEIFSDDNFRAYLKESFDEDNDNVIDTFQVKEINCNNKQIKSLKGIELFTKLTRLECQNNMIEELDLSNNSNLNSLSCSYNQLGYLNLRNNLALTYTQCDNQLISATSFNGASNGRFDYSIYKGFDAEKVSKLEGGDFEDNVLYVNDIGRGNGKITYTYNCGNGQSMDVTIDNINKVVSMKYDAPELESIKNSTVGVQFKWLPVEDATQYRVYRKSDDSVWMKMADTFATEYIDTTVESGKTYAYTVCCVSEDSKAFLSEYNQNGISIMFIATPNISEAINSNEGIQLAWKEVEGANRYRVYRKSQSEDWQNVAETNETSFIDEKVNIGDEYTYTVCCVDANGEDVVSDFNQTGIMVECTISPQDIKNRNDYAEYKSSIITLVNAQAVDGDSEASKKLIKDAISQINQKAYSATSSLDNNKQEIRKILEKLEKDLVAQRQQEKEDKEKEEANKGEEPGKGDTPVKPEAMLSTPSLTSLVTVNDGLKLSWKPVDKAEKYRVFRKDKNGSWQKVADVIKPEYVDKNVSDGTSYTYTVRCVDKSGSKYRSEYDKTGRTCMYVKPVHKVDVKYMTHIQSYGWEKDYKSNGQMSGTSGQSKRLEAIKIKVEGNADLGIQYVTHCQTYGWLNWSANDEVNGTSGEAKRLEAIEINLTGKDKDKYDVYYRVHAQSYGWLGWAKNGAASGTAGYAKRLEGIQIVVLKKGEQLNKNTNGISSNDSRPYISKSQSNTVIPGGNVPHVTYKTHVQSYGWQNWKSDGEMAGTSGQSKRLEGINIKISNCEYSGDIVYTTHVQTYGWQGKENDISTWKKNGEMAGTSGEAKRLEAIRIAITGEMAKKYDVYYRVHAQSYGWLGWAKNGEASGTAGYAKRLEGIQIVLVKKGGKAPEENYGGISCNDKRPYISK